MKPEVVLGLIPDLSIRAACLPFFSLPPYCLPISKKNGQRPLVPEKNDYMYAKGPRVMLLQFEALCYVSILAVNTFDSQLE